MGRRAGGTFPEKETTHARAKREKLTRLTNKKKKKKTSMSSHNNNNNNGQPPRRNRDGPSGADKGKGRALPRPPTPDASLGWGATEDPEPMEVLPTPTGLAPIKRKPPPKKGKKTRGQKRREREQREEDELHGWDSDDSNMKALAGEAVPHAREAQQLLAHRCYNSSLRR